ncbi:hypothetical protein Pla52o_07740 [Novipirellula galeiformis]|uniref:Uncharacterized protein n=1 Tax=Novipirellula galeiformis TaxID=2528004 RepID=A0A5C6CRC5_9BACT|nr:hypothetical protein [Novipirellula galeiformis]TWU26918.1 hypothetical protein Pla52o_07740 [Novipirellula galeiformis]
MKSHKNVVSSRRSRTLKSTARFVFAGALAATLATPSTAVQAADCGCKSAIHKDGGIALPLLNVGRAAHGCPPKHGPIYRSLDAFAGGIEKMLGLDKCRTAGGCDDLGCDGGCDAAPSDTFLYGEHPIDAPYPSDEHESYGAPLPMSAAEIGEPRMPPQRMSEPRIITPHSPMQMSEPMIRSTPPESRPRTGRAGSLPVSPAPRQVESIGPGVSPEQRGIPVPPADAPRSAPQETRPAPAQPKTDGGSLFDSLSDPFSEDEVRVRPFPKVRQTQYEVPKVNRTKLPHPQSL